MFLQQKLERFKSAVKLKQLEMYPGVIIFVDKKSVVRVTEKEIGNLGGNSTKDY